MECEDQAEGMIEVLRYSIANHIIRYSGRGLPEEYIQQSISQTKECYKNMMPAIIILNNRHHF